MAHHTDICNSFEAEAEDRVNSDAASAESTITCPNSNGHFLPFLYSSLLFSHYVTTNSILLHETSYSEIEK